MDFDDLDDAIEERIAAGDTEGMENFAFQKKDLKSFDGELPKLASSKGLWTLDDEGSRTEGIRLRAFVFYGPGDVAEDMKSLAQNSLTMTGWLEFAVHEWPGHGGRKDEPFAEDVDALANDAFETMKSAFEQVKEDADCEGAPFAFIGRSVGCQVMAAVAKKVLMNYGMAPAASIVMDRGAPQFPLLSEEGLKVLDSNPDKVVKAFYFKDYNTVDKKSLAKDLRYACETQDPFYHKYDCDMMVVKSNVEAAFLEKGKKTSKYKMTTLQVKGSNEFFQMPVESSTTVSELMGCVSKIFAYKRGTECKAFTNDGKAIQGFDTVSDSITVEGISDFKHPRHTWPHPVCVIGGGFFGIKMAMEYHRRNNHNVVVIDRLPEAGGYAWHTSATKYSRVQTDFGAFNIWWGHQFTFTGDAGWGTEAGGRAQFTKAFLGPGSPMNGTVPSGAGTGHDANPVKAQVIGAMQYAMKEYGIDKVARFSTEVSTLEIVGKPDWDGRCYKLGLTDLSKNPERLGDKQLGEGDFLEEIKVSVVMHFPGAYDINRQVVYPGEAEFGGQIGYGMGNGQGGLFKWDDDKFPMKGTKAAVLGNGAFAVENVRSCIEQGASKVYIITRRKSLLCPRMPCWFCHQGPVPTPASFLLDAFAPMYEAAKIEDPWTFYAVHGNEKRTDCIIRQSSRFGIGDIAFLAHAIGLFEYRVGVVERFSHKTAHLSTGEKLGLDHVCKALGLIGDIRVDQLHAMTFRLGNMVNGDWRRIVNADATGMDAKRFTTFSAGPGACGYAKMWYYIHNHPWEMRAAQQHVDWKLLQKHVVSDTQPDQPCYMTNVQYEMFAGNVMGNLLPLSNRVHGDESGYKYALIHSMHPTEKYIEYCKADWDRYQTLIKEHTPGFENVERVEYPYTIDMVKGWFERYAKQLKVPITTEGPTEAFKKQVLDNFIKLEKYLNDETIPHLIRECKLLSNVGEDDDPMAEAYASSIYALKKGLTGTPPDSALDFDEEQIEKWKDYISADYTIDTVECGCLNRDMLTNEEVWGKITPYLAERK